MGLEERGKSIFDSAGRSPKKAGESERVEAAAPVRAQAPKPVPMKKKAKPTARERGFDPATWHVRPEKRELLGKIAKMRGVEHYELVDEMLEQFFAMNHKYVEAIRNFELLNEESAPAKKVANG